MIGIFEKIAGAVIGILGILFIPAALTTVMLLWHEIQDLRREFGLISLAFIWGYGIGLPLILRLRQPVTDDDDEWHGETLSLSSSVKKSKTANFALWPFLILWLVCCILMLQDLLALPSLIGPSGCAPDDFACRHPGRF